MMWDSRRLLGAALGAIQPVECTLSYRKIAAINCDGMRAYMKHIIFPAAA